MPMIMAIPHGKGLSKIPEVLSFYPHPIQVQTLPIGCNIWGILGTSVSVEELKANDPRLRELNTVYRNHPQLKNISIIVYCENEKTSGVLVVNKTSADPGKEGVTPIPLDENHITIAKPQSKQSLVYLGVKKFIKDCLSKSLKKKD